MFTSEEELIILSSLQEIINYKEHIEPDFPLVEIGFNSINFIELVIVLQEQFSINLSDEDFLIENFDTIKKIIETCQRLRK